jgi:UDP-N-acetyl-D-mannosaminuronate dehydrogenase
LDRHCLVNVQNELNKAGKPVNGARIAVFGVSYKQGVSDIRESPALKIIEPLTNQGTELCNHDPKYPHSPTSHRTPYVWHSNSHPAVGPAGYGRPRSKLRHKP